jgi:hypothetical protein
MDTMKKIITYLLIFIVLIFMVVAILGIWDIIDLKNVMINTLFSLIVIFAASAVILFIYSVFMRDSDRKPF